MTQEQIHTAHEQSFHWMKNTKGWIPRKNISVRAAGILTFSLLITSDEELEEAFSSGALIKARGCGIGTYNKIAKLFGKPLMKRHTGRRCRCCGQIIRRKKRLDTGTALES